MKVKEYILVIIVFLLVACGGNSSNTANGSATDDESKQSTAILSALTFASYDQYIRITKDDVYIRESPSNKAAKVEYDRYPGTLMACDMCPVISEDQGWFQIPEGWVSKKDAKLAVNDPITAVMMNNQWCGHVIDMGDGFMWRVYSPIGIKQLAICDCNGVLRLGKLIDNVFEFKYAVSASIEIDEEHPDRWELEEYEDGKYIHMGTNYGKQITEEGWEDATYTYWLPDLSKFTDQHLIQIFKDVIEANETNYLYLNSELLSGKWVGNIP
ncbi:MAG: hypothetical protein J5720_06140 [Bacteroidaceae bacterium]|nr:hypothetical protein [Bacteroidaceae bacterium]